MSRPAHLVCPCCLTCQDPNCPVPNSLGWGDGPCTCPTGIRWQARGVLAHDLHVLGFAVGELWSAIHRALPGWRWWATAAALTAAALTALTAALVAR